MSVLTDFTGKGVLVYIFAASDNDIDHIDFITENKCRNMELITQWNDILVDFISLQDQAMNS